MPYTERRGKDDNPYPWSVKYQRPDGSWKRVSGFADEDVALKHGLDMEADIRRGRWVDDRRESTLVSTLCEDFIEAQRKSRKSGRTVANRVRIIRNHIIPAFGHLTVEEVNWLGVQNWASACPRARRTITDTVSLFRMVMWTSVDGGLLKFNPLAGRRLTDLPAPSAPKVWAQPEQVYRMTLRCPTEALRLHILTHAYLGLRPGEVQAVTRESLVTRKDTVDGRPFVRTVLVIDPLVGQVIDYYEPSAAAGGKAVRVVHLGPPKPPNGPREVDVPPFLARLFEAHAKTWPHEYLMCREDGEWWHEPAFIENIFRRIVEGRGSRLGGKLDAREAWEPIAPGLTPHGLRHSHNTWMDEDRINRVLMCDRMGHEYKVADERSSTDIYAHPTPAMRLQLVKAMEVRWRNSQPSRRLALVAA